jgi:lipopolysaccharide transport system ATP-binding protein
MTEVARGGKTVLFVSHNMAAVQQLCPRCFLFQAGRLANNGPTERIVAEYLRDASSSRDGCFDLSMHPARSRKHSPLIRSLALRSREGQPTTCFHPEDGLEAELLIEPSMPIRAPRIAVSIEDALGRRITTVASYFLDQQLDDIETPCRVRCTLPQLRLGSGRYLISVSIGDRYAGLLDSLDCAAWFEVVWNNNYGNGEPYHPVYGPVLTQSRWERVS